MSSIASLPKTVVGQKRTHLSLSDFMEEEITFPESKRMKVDKQRVVREDTEMTGDDFIGFTQTHQEEGEEVRIAERRLSKNRERVHLRRSPQGTNLK